MCHFSRRWGKIKVHSFLGVIAFLSHAPKKSSAAKMDSFLSKKSREMAQIVGRQNVGSMHVKRSDPEKTRTLLFPEKIFPISGRRPETYSVAGQ